MDTRGEMAVQQRMGPSTHAGDDEDARLWAAVVSGDDSAFDALVSRHCVCIASVASRFLRDPNDIEDVVQEAFVRAYAARHRHPNRHSVRAWLLRIAINLCKSRLRASWWRRVWLTGAFSAEPSSAENPMALAEESLLRREVAEAVQRLPERLRLPFLLRYFEELSGAEIAAALGCTESTVWTRIYAARRQIREQLTDSPSVMESESS